MKFTDAQYKRVYNAWITCSGSTREVFEVIVEEALKPDLIMCKYCGGEVFQKNGVWSHTKLNKYNETSIFCSWTVAEPA